MQPETTHGTRAPASGAVAEASTGMRAPCAVPGGAASRAERRTLSHRHRDIDHVLERIEALGEMSGNLDAPELANALHILLQGVGDTLLPHLEWEETVCYPDLERLAGTPWATRVLRIQHEQLRQAISILGTGLPGQEGASLHQRTAELRARLYRLHALLYAHLEQEESVALPFLDGDRVAGTA